MSFLIQRTAGRGLSLTQISSAVLRIGRGTNQELRSENPAVALEHAIIEGDAAGYLVTDKGSITGTYVNRKPVETSRLSKGDVIEIGDLRIEVQMADPAKPLFLRVVTSRVSPVAMLDDEEDVVVTPAAAAAPGAVIKPKKIDYVGAYRLARPYLTKLSITALLLIFALALVGQIIETGKQTMFIPGGVSSAHARARDRRGTPIAERCDACHDPFQSVSNQKCIDCHAQEPHAQFESNPPDCFTCHAEHRGSSKLAAIGDDRCVGCHADLSAHVRVPRTQLASARFGGGRYSFDNIARIAVFGDQHPELAYSTDRNPLRFNHKLHLAPRGVFNDTGRREVLECKSCHEMATVKGKIDPVAIDYEPHCQRCHRLTFDARIPDEEVPHGGDPSIVYGYVGVRYSGNRDLIGKPPAEVRRILTARKGVAIDTRAQVNADHVVKTKCQKCHDIVRRGEQLAVTPPLFTAQWLANAQFTHTRHVTIACDKCHEGVRESVPTSDVLLPKLKNCTECHAPNARITQAASTCLTCHEYHLRPKRPMSAAALAPLGISAFGGRGRMLQEILLVAIVLLLLVLMVPVGIALFQRLRTEKPTATPAPRQPAKPPAPSTQKMPAIQADLPTDKVLRRDVPAPAPPPPPMAAPDATRADIELPKTPRTKLDRGGGEGTEMVQWYGLLNCTSGPLEGQRFVIEEDGFYIGRDPSMAKVVVPDTKISKRHVRIVPRDGKVWAIDSGSTNGTFLAGSPQRITEVQLKRGDTLVLGDNVATFVYQI